MLTSPGVFFKEANSYSVWLVTHVTARYDSFRFYAKVDLLQTEKLHKTERVVSDQPARTAQADLKRHFTQMPEYPFSRIASHIMCHIQFA